MTDAGRARPGHVLRVMSYNLRDFLDDRHAAARVVRAVDPDVLCLQEVPRRLTTEVRLPPFARECGLLWSRRRRGSGGTAVLTAPRVRVHAATTTRLPVRFPDRTRGYAALDLSLPGSPPLTVVSVHLSLRADERERHTRRLLADLSVDAAGGRGSRLVVAGDLNEGPGGRARDLLTGSLRILSPDEPTFPARAPDQRLDLVLGSPGLRVRPADRVPLAEADLVAASDHRPVWVDLDVRSV
ncbi:MAG: endonuclease/exonuclease/phosphatase family protein [Terracoccus sp.]